MGACRGWKAKKADQLDGWPRITKVDGHINQLDLKQKKLTGKIPKTIRYRARLRPRNIALPGPALNS